MSYTKQDFKNGEVLTAEQLNAMDAQIAKNELALLALELLTEDDVNSLIDAKLGVIENGSY